MNWKERFKIFRYKLHDGVTYKPKHMWEVRLIRALRPVGNMSKWIWRKLKALHVLVVIVAYILLFIAIYYFKTSADFRETLIGCPSGNVAEVANSVVKVVGDQATGSAFWWDSKTVITNNHVIDHNQHLKIATPDNTAYDAQVIATDSLRDIAVLTVPKAPAHFTPQKSPKIPQLANDVIAIGYPEGRNLTVTKGIVSAFTADDYDDRSYIQTDAAINPGNSGGILVDSCGRVVGMNTQTLQNAQNIGFAINAD